jgi:hypothetical protein
LPEPEAASPQARSIATEAVQPISGCTSLPLNAAIRRLTLAVHTISFAFVGGIYLFIRMKR